jgi:hypothetical protein
MAGWQSARRGGERCALSAVLGSGMRKHATQLAENGGPYVKLALAIIWHEKRRRQQLKANGWRLKMAKSGGGRIS